jgi:hypothetical protein
VIVAGRFYDDCGRHHAKAAGEQSGKYANWRRLHNDGVQLKVLCMVFRRPNPNSFR